MESLVSLESYEPELQKYLLQQNYPVILEVGGAAMQHACTQSLTVVCYVCMQALLTGLAVMLPENPWQFVIEKLSWLRDGGDSIHIQWYDSNLC